MKIPDWIQNDAWQGFVDMRKKLRRPMTDRAVALIVAKLEGFRDAGEDIEAVLDQSTENSWQSVFPLRKDNNAKQYSNQRVSFPSLGKHGQATANNLQEWLEESP